MPEFKRYTDPEEKPAAPELKVDPRPAPEPKKAPLEPMRRPFEKDRPTKEAKANADAE